MHGVVLDLIFFMPATCGVTAVAAWIAYLFRSFDGGGSQDGGDGGQRSPVPGSPDRRPDGPSSVARRDLARSA